MIYQPYVSWKDAKHKEAVMGNKRPESNLGHVYNKNINYLNDANTSDACAFRARPIKHWRKQLITNKNEGTKERNVIYNDKPGSSILSQYECCSGEDNSFNIISNINASKNNNFNVSGSYTVTSDDINNGWNGPVGKRICCNRVANRIKPATTVINKKYCTEYKMYLRKRNKSFERHNQTSKYPNVEYLTATGEIIWPSDATLNSSMKLMSNCEVNCYKPTIYKPNNYNYSTQGAVSSSTRLLRLKQNTVNSNGSSFRTAFGAQAANAGKYTGSMTAPYFIKSKMYTPMTTLCYC